MEKLILQDVRCFRTRVEARLAPVTLLIGENSTGKSSFLALTQVAAQLAESRTPNFNTQPFELGAYDSIAHYHGGQAKRAREFTVGATFPGRSMHHLSRARSGPQQNATIEGTFRSEDGQPRLAEWKCTIGNNHASINLRQAKAVAQVQVGKIRTEVEFDAFPAFMPLHYALRTMVSKAIADSKGSGERMPASLVDFVETATGLYGFRTYPIAPIRTRPERTYDPVHDQPSPGGEHIPVILSQMRTRGRGWEDVQTALNSFGKASGLFNTFDIRHFGRKSSADPFQLEVAIGGQKGKRNIIDVGYGVSQVLPILVESLIRNRSGAGLS